MKKMAVAVMDPNPLVRLALKELLPPDSAKICGMLSRYSALQLMLDDGMLDAVIIELFDETTQILDGINFIKKNKHHWDSISLIIVTAVEHPFLIKTAIKFKPCAIVSKRDCERELDIAIYRAFSSVTYCSPAISRIVNDTSQNPLSDRELYVLTQLITGRTMMQISSILDLSYKTIHGHKNRILKKTGIKTLAVLTKTFRW